MHPFLKSCHFQPLASFWSHNLASWNIYISTSLKLLLHAWQKKQVHCCYLPLSSTVCKNIHTQFPWPSYMLSSGSNIIFSLTALAELVFKKVFFFRFKQFILYLLFRLFLSTSGGPCRLQVNSRRCCCLKLLESLRARYYLNR